MNFAMPEPFEVDSEALEAPPHPRRHSPLRHRHPQQTTTSRRRPRPSAPVPRPALHQGLLPRPGDRRAHPLARRRPPHLPGFVLTGALPAPGTQLEAEGKPVGELTSVASIPLPGQPAPIQLALGYHPPRGPRKCSGPQPHPHLPRRHRNAHRLALSQSPERIYRHSGLSEAEGQNPSISS